MKIQQIISLHGLEPNDLIGRRGWNAINPTSGNCSRDAPVACEENRDDNGQRSFVCGHDGSGYAKPSRITSRSSSTWLPTVSRACPAGRSAYGSDTTSLIRHSTLMTRSRPSCSRSSALKDAKLDCAEKDEELMKLFLHELNQRILAELERERARKRGGSGPFPGGRHSTFQHVDVDLEAIDSSDSAPDDRVIAQDQVEALLLPLDRHDPVLRAWPR